MKKVRPSITLRKFSDSPPEYHLIISMGIARIKEPCTVYSAKIIEDHYLLTCFDVGCRREDLGIRHTETEANNRLVELARADFNQRKKYIENPTPEQAEQDRQLRRHYGLGTKPDKWDFVDETA
jgi:hypothetical protein